MKKLKVLLILTLVVSAFSNNTPRAAADAEAPVLWRSVVHVGDTVKYGNKTWVVLDPNTGYLIASDLDGARPFDTNNNQLFNPGDGSNIASWLNGSYYNNLSDRLWIQDFSWKIGNELDESGMSVNAKVGLLSYYESRLYRPYLGTPAERYWLITPQQRSPFYVWFLNTTGSTSAITANNSRAVRPAIHLKSALSISSGTGQSSDPYVIMNHTPVIELSGAAGGPTLSTKSGSESFSISGKVSDADGGDVTVSATLGEVTKTATVAAAPISIPAADNFTLTWNTSVDALGNGVSDSVVFKADDGNGAVGSSSYNGTITIDTIAPNKPTFQFTSPAGYASGGASKEDVAYTILSGTDMGTGVLKSQYRTRINGGTWGEWTDYSVPLEVSQAGRTDMEAVTLDVAGNLSQTAQAQILIDKTAPTEPTVNFVAPPGYISGTDSYQDIMFTVSDGTDSEAGVLKSQYRTSEDNGLTWSSWTDYESAVSLSKAGRTDIEARTLDKAGNESDSVSAHVQIIKAAPTASNAAVTGTPTEGQTLTGSYSYADMNGDAENGTTYQWYRSDDAALTTNRTPIPGAVTNTYTLQAADVGKYISFEVTPRSAREPVTGVPAESHPVKIAAAPAAPVAASVTVSGLAAVGQTLTGDFSYSDVNGDVESGSTYQWYRSDDSARTVNHTPIAGAVTKTYVLQAADVDKYISFEVTPKTEAEPATGTAAESAATGRVVLAPTEPAAAGVTVSGLAAEGQTLTGEYSYSDLNGDAESGSTYQWYRSDDPARLINRTAIPHATSKEYLLQAEDIGKYISFEVVPRNKTAPTTGFAVESAATDRVIAGPKAPTATPVTITGDPVVGESLSGSYTYGDVNGDVENGTTYQWYRSDNAALTVNHKAIEQATSSTYILQADDEGKYISFEVTPKNGAVPTTGIAAESAATDKVIPAAAAPTVSGVTVTGTAVAGQTLTGSYSYQDVNSDEENGTTYQWYRSDDSAMTMNHTPIAGAVNRTYTLQADDVGKYISFEVTPRNAELPTTGTALESAVLLIKAAPVVQPDPDPATPGTSGPGPVGPDKEFVNIDVEAADGSNGNVISTLVIERILKSDGSKKDVIQLTSDQIAKVIDVAKAGLPALTLLVPDLKDEVSETTVTLPSAVVKLLDGAKVGLRLVTRNAQMQIPAASLQNILGGLEISLIPAKTDAAKQIIQDRIRKDSLVTKHTGSREVKVLARPMSIDTNLQGREVTLILPLPSLIKLSESELKDLAVYIEHSDGSKQLIRGTVVPYSSKGDLGLKFTVDKFSTFTIISAEGLAGANLQAAYMKGYSDGTFKPDARITRAEIASILARVISNPDQTGSMAYSDVKSAHWAKDAIAKVTSMGLMQGYTNSTFGPDRSITRAEMAKIVSLLIRSEDKTSPGFKDTTGHWAESAILKVQAAGIIRGYSDQSFRPEQSLTRAEAVVIMNKVLQLAPVSGEVHSEWSDVPDSHWALRDITVAAAR
ncbi:S-layer homology domain-containing protein [Paenibacillus sp. YPG26]|uniref:S-layer homology domain-containing protein n=1 Tax=Paenibacillus sp. YPG26 TaxID=2878915 RepID=UPI0020402C07|nr:S-layer homology domain-containing protein [Paenibacillus sp. YPG26]USB33945.1 S-layer homology domain-containing protein [Paenibacillus sp. YPG26]